MGLKIGRKTEDNQKLINQDFQIFGYSDNLTTMTTEKMMNIRQLTDLRVLSGPWKKIKLPAYIITRFTVT